MGVVRVSSEREEPKACVQITGANTGMELLCVGEREEGERREEEEKREEGERREEVERGRTRGDRRK